ncbi:hypothetical protein HDU99_008073, partial [Rhizoclosmatium hyalinum]
SSAVPRRVRKASLILSTSITPQQKPQWRYAGPQTTSAPVAATTTSTAPRVLYKAVSTVKPRATSPTPVKSPSTGTAYTSTVSGITSTAKITIAARNQLAKTNSAGGATAQRPGSSVGTNNSKKLNMTPTTIRVPSKKGATQDGRATPLGRSVITPAPTPLPPPMGKSPSGTAMQRTKSSKTTVRIGPATGAKKVSPATIA